MDRVFVYRNLHRHCFSLRDAKTRIVTGYASHVVLAKADLVVSQKGRERVLREKRKNVHAGIRGLLLFAEESALEFRKQIQESDWVKLYYNPYKTAQFIRTDTREPVLKTGLVYLAPSGPWMLP